MVPKGMGLALPRSSVAAVLADFEAGADSDDTINLSTFGDFTFELVMAGARDVDGNVEFDLGNDHFTLVGVTTRQLHQDDFLI